MVTLEEILKKDVEETEVPIEMKERLLANILKKLMDLMNSKNNSDS